MDAYDWLILLSAGLTIAACAAYVLVALVRDIYRD